MRLWNAEDFIPAKNTIPPNPQFYLFHPLKTNETSFPEDKRRVKEANYCDFMQYKQIIRQKEMNSMKRNPTVI